MVNYSYGKIYKITSESTGLVYYGSTALYYLSKRLSTHIQDYKKYLRGKHHYISAFKLLECEDYKIELIKDFPCANKSQLTTEEGKYIRENECVNLHIPGKTKEENHKAAKEYRKEYYIKNIDRHKELNKIWRETNKDKIKHIDIEYRKQNKQKIDERRSKPYTCECGSTIIWGNKSKHFKTKKHCEYINNL